MNDVLTFIKHFGETQDTFLYGCCYWFAEILRKRFRAKIYYNQVQNHFASCIKGHFYDVSGEICGDGYMSWDQYKSYDPLDYQRIVRDCINKIE